VVVEAGSRLRRTRKNTPSDAFKELSYTQAAPSPGSRPAAGIKVTPVHQAARLRGRHHPNL